MVLRIKKKANKTKIKADSLTVKTQKYEFPIVLP